MLIGICERQVLGFWLENLVQKFTLGPLVFVNDTVKQSTHLIL